MGTTSCIGGDPGATACMKTSFLVSWGRGGGGGGPGGGGGVNAQIDLRTATKAPFWF
jgi:hypothetical protein